MTQESSMGDGHDGLVWRRYGWGHLDLHGVVLDRLDRGDHLARPATAPVERSRGPDAARSASDPGAGVAPRHPRPAVRRRRERPRDVPEQSRGPDRGPRTVSYTHLRAHETKANLVCRL